MKARFYLTYLSRVMVNERAHTLMTILAIAVGVTVLGADLTLSKGVQESFTRNIRETVGGDIVARSEKEPFTAEHIARLAALKRQGAIKDFAAEASLLDMAGNGSMKTMANFWFIDPARHPLYGPKLKSSLPRGRVVNKLLTNGVIVSELMADKLDISVGDQITLGMDAKKYKVAGIISDYVQPSLDMRVTGFIIRPLGQFKEALKYTPEKPEKVADAIYIKTSTPAEAKGVSKSLVKIFPRFSVLELAAAQAEPVKAATEAYRQGDAAFGFLSLLIAGIGIGYSMRLWARRRLRDISILKALGLKTRQVKALFLLGLGVMTVAGGALGLVFSAGAVLLLREFARRFIGIPAQISLFYPRELALVLAAALLVVTAFSLASISALSRALPAVALRFQEGDLPNVGWLRRAGLSVLFVLLLTGAATLVIGDAKIAAPITIGALALGGVSLLLFKAAIVLLPARLPLGVGYKLAARSLKSRGWMAPRTALVILVGITALSLVLVLSETIKVGVEREVKKLAGHDAIIYVPPGAPGNAERTIKSVPGGVRNMVRGRIAPVDIVSINHNRRTLAKRLDGLMVKDPYVFDMIHKINLVDLSTYRNWRTLEAGRPLGAGDRGRKVMVVSGRVAGDLKLNVGESVEIKSDSGIASLKVIGITERSQMVVVDDMVAPAGAVSARKTAASYYVNFKSDDKKAAIRWLNRRLGQAAILDSGQLSAAFADVIDGIKVFPLLISLLTLIAAAVLIVSGVSLSVINRRRELAILKSLGAKSRRILRLLVTEHLMIGLAGGLLAAALTVPLAYMATTSMFKRPAAVNFLAVAAVVLLAVALSIASSLAPAVGAARAKPLEVLRDE